MQLDGLDALDSFDLNAIFSSIGQTIQKQAPALIKSVMQQQVQKLTAPKAAAPVAVPVPTALPVMQQATGTGIKRKFVFIGGGLLLGGTLLYIATR